MNKEITSGCKRVTVLIRGEWAGHSIEETVTVEYWMTRDGSPLADDVAVVSVRSACGVDMLQGEGELDASEMTPRIAHLYRAACEAVADRLTVDQEDDWMGWDAWPMPHDDPADRIAIAASAARGY